MSDYHDPLGRMLEAGEGPQIEPANPAIYVSRPQPLTPAQQHFATILSQFLAATIHHVGPPPDAVEWDRWVSQCADMTQSVIRRAAVESLEKGPTVSSLSNRSL